MTKKQKTATAEYSALQERAASLQTDLQKVQGELLAAREALESGSGDVEAVAMLEARERALSGALASVQSKLETIEAERLAREQAEAAKLARQTAFDALAEAARDVLDARDIILEERRRALAAMQEACGTLAAAGARWQRSYAEYSAKVAQYSGDTDEVLQVLSEEERQHLAKTGLRRLDVATPPDASFEELLSWLENGESKEQALRRRQSAALGRLPVAAPPTLEERFEKPLEAKVIEPEYGFQSAQEVAW
jgi:DNA repair exonuclease SbcCD ATPase subunit